MLWALPVGAAWAASEHAQVSDPAVLSWRAEMRRSPPTGIASCSPPHRLSRRTGRQPHRDDRIDGRTLRDDR